VRNRREFLWDAMRGAAALWTGAMVPGVARGADEPGLALAGLPSGTLEESVLDALPGKRPLIKRTFRPPNYETPLEYFNQPFTPNDAFFVRYHLSNIPQVSAESWRLEISGDSVERPVAVTLEALQRDFEQVELAALCLCSGNRRGLSDPHVAGVQWGHGAMGNARWKGVRLRDVLAKAGVKKEALEVVLDGADSPLLEATPDFVKSLPAWKALDENALLAWEMNGAPLPHWNGFPVRLVVPGWTATYWTKHIVSIRVVSEPFKGFWMNPAYRIPKGKFPLVDRFVSQETETTTPITEMVVNSLITNVRPGQRVRLGRPVELRGIAWDGGYGIQVVEASTDGGRSWRLAELGADLGKFSWRPFSHTFTPDRPGPQTIMVKATNRLGASQAADLIFNPAGYHNNLVQKIGIQVG
jgi:DMSO/TMAO reductase YedYZ molybdopterin-dependent catalytic subunit